MASIQKYRTGKGEARYRVHYRDATGRQAASQSFRRRADAQHFLDQVGHQRVTGTLSDRKAGQQTFGALFDETLDGNFRRDGEEYAPSTRALYENIRDRHLGELLDRRIADVSPALVARVLARIKASGLRAKTRAVVSMVFQNAVDAGRIAQNPARRTKRTPAHPSRMEREERNLDSDSLRRFIDAVPIRYRAMVKLMATIGIRPGEAYGLTVGQVGPVLTIDRTDRGPTKTRKARRIPLPRTIHEMLAHHIATYSDPTDPDALVFTTAHGEPVRKDSFRQLLGRASKRAAIQPAISPNDLRHTAAAFAIGNGADVYAVQRMLGHAKASITLNVYGHLWDASLERLAERLDEALRV